jgi:hypothetical protein
MKLWIKEKSGPAVFRRSRSFATIHVICWGECWGWHMARRTKRLSSRTVASLAKPGRHADGEGLYLIIDKGSAKRWAFIFRWKAPGQTGPGKLREMGLGGLSAVSLAEARERAGEARRLLANGRNPIDARRHAEAARQSATTFGALADALVEDLQHGWRSKTSKASWSKTIATHAAALRELPVDAIQTADVLAVLTPIWQTRNETASRLRGRIERVLDAARAKGLRSGENPARWRGHLDKLLPRRQKLAKGHHAALPYADVPAFVSELRKREGSVPLALEFIILNASRAGEVFGGQVVGNRPKGGTLGDPSQAHESRARASCPAVGAGSGNPGHH